MTVRGNRRIEASAILARVGTKAGARYSPAQIARDVREVQALGFFRNVRIFIGRDARGTAGDLRRRGEPGRAPDHDLGQRVDRRREDPRHPHAHDRLHPRLSAALREPRADRGALPRRGLLPRRGQLRHRAAQRGLRQHQLRGRRGREAQAARDRLRRQRALQRPRAARGLPDPDLALLVDRDLLVRPLRHLLGAALHPGPAQRREALHRRGLPARRGGRAGRGGRQGRPDRDGLDQGGPALPGRQARHQGRRHGRRRGAARAARAAGGRHLQPQLPHRGRRQAHGILRRPRLLLRERDAALEPLGVDRDRGRHLPGAQGAALLRSQHRRVGQHADRRRRRAARDPDRRGPALLAARR